ncbi:MAG: NAD(P)-binding protein [Bacteroidetes bacterium]|nr:NAD(P)-binding protein [Bacteroidota bacterium]
MSVNIETSSKICIVGAGPAGSTTALFLAKLGVQCILLDRTSFPRDKVCGESFDGHVTSTLRQLGPSFLAEAKNHLLECRRFAVVNSQSKRLMIAFSSASTARLLGRRLDFDNFLIEKIKQSPLIDFRENSGVKSISRTGNNWELRTEQGEILQPKMLIWAAGTSSLITNQLLIKKAAPENDFLFVRGYFQGITNYCPGPTVEFYFVKKPVPLCIYICPVNGSISNVEIGLNREFAINRRLNLRHLLMETIENHPDLKERFKGARLLGSFKGAKMQLPSSKATYSGNGFLLVGDSAASIHPITGFGVGHAMAQAKIAAEIAAKSIVNKDTSAAFLKQYDNLVIKKLGKEIKFGRLVTFSLRYVSILDKLAGISSLQGIFEHRLSDSHFVKKLMRPFTS